MQTSRLAACVLLASVALAPGCGPTPGSGSHADEPPQFLFDGQHPIGIVCTVGQVADIVEQVGGQHVSVRYLIGHGGDPHIYPYSAQDVTTLDSADMIFYSGLHLEGTLASILESLAEHKPCFAVTDGVPRNLLIESPDFPGNYDPHVWFDVRLWARAVELVRDRLSEFDPAHAMDYHQRTLTYLAQLAELDAYCREQIATIPEGRRVLITAHDAFEYLGRAYRLEVLGIQGLSTAVDPAGARIDELVNFIVQRDIPMVFPESSVSDENLRALVEGCAARGHEVALSDIELYSDAMGEEGTTGGTYIGMVRHNIDTIVGALR